MPYNTHKKMVEKFNKGFFPSETNPYIPISVYARFTPFLTSHSIELLEAVKKKVDGLKQDYMTAHVSFFLQAEIDKIKNE